MKPLVHVHNVNSLYNQGYYGDALLNESKAGFYPREVKPGPKKK